MMRQYRPKTRVLVAIPVLLIGGTEVHTLNLARVLLNGEFEVIICCYYDYDESMVERFRKDGIEVILMGLNRESGLWRLAKALVSLFKKINPDIIHVQYIAPGFMAVAAARLAGVKRILATVHQPGHPYGWTAKFLLLTAARLSTAFICNSRAVEESWFGNSELFDPGKVHGRRRHFTIYNSVDAVHISEISNSADRREIKRSLGIADKPVVGIAARLRMEKGQAVLLDAMSEVIKIIPEARLVLVGDGPDREQLKKRASVLGIAGQVLWLGQKAHEEALRLYSVMDVVAVPSLFEGFGLSAAEAMAASVPVVASRVDGLAEVIEDGVSGYLVDAGDSRNLACAISELLSNREKAKTMGRKGKEIVHDRFSGERFSRLMLMLYRSVLNQK